MPKSMKHPERRIGEHYETACNLALSLVEEYARKILAEHPSLDEFVMGMGGAMFTTKQGENLDTDERAYMKRLDDLLCEWDNYLKLTGSPMRFTANGPRVTEW